MSLDCGGAACDVSGGGVDMLVRRPTRQKRMRTSFKHHELRIMKSYFALNHNPDAKDLKQLSIKTGLSKRVLQVSYVLTNSHGCMHACMHACMQCPFRTIRLASVYRGLHCCASKVAPPIWIGLFARSCVLSHLSQLRSGVGSATAL
jgi:hypothetical protein